MEQRSNSGNKPPLIIDSKKVKKGKEMNETLNEIINDLREKLRESVERNRAEGLLFSGGLDSGILACLCPEIKAITVSIRSWGEDPKYAEVLSKYLNLEHYQVVIDTEEAIEAIPEVIQILGSFDPAIPNDITVYFGLKTAKKLGIKTVMTGDGSDELFVGYTYMQDIPFLENYIERLSKSMYFSSNKLGRFFNVEIRQPFIDKDFVNFSLQISVSLKLRKKQEKFIGKWILRKAFESMLPDEVIWQEKRPLEYGSGTTRLREIIASRIEDEEFEEAKNLYQVKFINKEHFYYYKIYLEKVGSIPLPRKGEKPCPGCGAGLKEDSFHCRVCGWTRNL